MSPRQPLGSRSVLQFFQNSAISQIAILNLPGKFCHLAFNGCFTLLQNIGQDPNGRGRHLHLDLGASGCDIGEAK